MFCKRGMLAAARLAAREERRGLRVRIVPTRAGFTRARTLSAVCEADVVTSGLPLSLCSILR